MRRTTGALRTLTFTAALTLAAALPAAAGVTQVPGDFADLQDAIDAASPGEVIVVRGGIHEAITVDKALNLVGVVGEEPFFQGSQPPAFAFNQKPAITLAGPGSGKVTLANLVMGGPACGSFYSSAAPAIQGGGFDELALMSCDVSAPVWEFLTGFGSSVAAIDVSVPYIVVQSSSVTGGQPGHDFFWDEPSIPGGSPGIEAPASTVTVCDSIVVGGAGLDADLFDADCPTFCASLSGGKGGPGIVADTVYQAAGTISGGPGGRISCESTGYLCTRPTGVPFEVETYDDLPGTLIGSGPLLPGLPWTFTYFTPSSSAVLLLSPFPQAPFPVDNKGLLFMAAPPLIVLGYPGGLTEVTLSVCGDPCTAGFPIVMQFFADNQLSRPLFGVISGS